MTAIKPEVESDTKSEKSSVLSKNIAEAVVIPPCEVPETGDWTVTAGCILRNDVNAPGNVTVNSGVLVTIDGNTTLKIDFTSHHLLVRKGGGVLIRKGSAIKQE